MRTVKRNLIFWGKNTEKQLGILWAFALLYTILFSFSSQDFAAEAKHNFLMYAVSFGVMLCLISPVSVTRYYLPMVLSFGAKRRETLWGLQWMNFLLGAQSCLLILLAGCVNGGDKFITGQNVMLVLSVFLILLTVAQILNAVCIRLGGKGMTVFIVVSVLLGVMIGSISSIMMGGDGETIARFLSGVLTGTLEMTTVLLIMAVSVTAYGISMLLLHLALRHYEVSR